MRRLAGMLLFASLTCVTQSYGAQTLHFTVTDARGKETSAVNLEAGPVVDDDGWQQVKITKAKGEAVMVWPFDGLAKLPDGPEPVPAIVIQRGDEKALANKRVVSSIIVPVLLGIENVAAVGQKTGFTAEALAKAFGALAQSSDPFEKGAGLLYAGKPMDAVESLALALKQRQRQLTRVPSEIYPAALLYGEALFKAGKFDAAAVAYQAALQQRPHDEIAGKMRAEALIKAGKGEAAGR